VPQFDTPRRSILALLLAVLASSVTLNGCDLGEAPDDEGIGRWTRLLCGSARSAAEDGLVFRYDLVFDCRFTDEDSILDWDIEPVGFPGENEVSVELDEEIDLDLEDAPRFDYTSSAQLTNLKRDITTGYGAMVQCHYASEDFSYAASGAVFIRDQHEYGVPQRFLAYVQITFYEYADCFGTSIDGEHRSNAVPHPEVTEIWRPLTTGAVEAPEGTRSVKISAVVNVPSGNAIGQPYEANFDQLTLAVLEEEVAPAP
jgi:hypothetical protein